MNYGEALREYAEAATRSEKSQEELKRVRKIREPIDELVRKVLEVCREEAGKGHNCIHEEDVPESIKGHYFLTSMFNPLGLVVGPHPAGKGCRLSWGTCTKKSLEGSPIYVNVKISSADLDEQDRAKMRRERIVDEALARIREQREGK